MKYYFFDISMDKANKCKNFSDEAIRLAKIVKKRIQEESAKLM